MNKTKKTNNYTIIGKQFFFFFLVVVIGLLILGFLIRQVNNQLIQKRLNQSLVSYSNWQTGIDPDLVLSDKIITDKNTVKVLTFAVIGDVHIGALEKNVGYLQQALEKAKNKQVEFVVILGDLTHNGSIEEYSSLKKLLDDSELKYYVVPGNHDIGAEARKDGLANYKKVFGGDTYLETIYPLNSGGKLKRVRLFLLDTALWRGKGVTSLGSDQWLWLKDKLENRGFEQTELRLFFSQMPFDKFSLTDSHYLRQFVCESFADGFFEADLHKTERFLRNCPVPLYNKQMEETALTFPTFKVGAIFRPIHEFPGFLIIRYFDNRFFETERIVLDEIN